MKNNRTRKLSQRICYALIAGMAGAFLIPQVGYAAPTGENVVSGGATISRSGNDTNISSSNVNNVIEWRDYSLSSTESVVHDGGAQTNNYLNIVTGANTSNINGKIKGGKDVYIVNPNGVIFGKSAEVNVGNLHVSTQDGVSTAAKTAFETGGTSPLDNTAALKADVVNMGKITATSVEVHGSHIRFLNAADVTATNPVKVYTDAPAASATDPDGGYAHIGYRGTAPTNYTAGNATSAAPEYYQLVANQSELNNINTNTTTLSGKYMLEQDIDLGGAAHIPIGKTGTPFTGKFDGNFFRVQNFNVSNQDSAGLFGEVSDGRIENLGVSKATIVGKRDDKHKYAGGIVGHTSGTSILKNVYATETTKVEGRRGRYGGIVGSTGSDTAGGSDRTIIDGAYSKAVLGKDDPGSTGKYTGGGIMGHSGNRTDISNSYSVATNDDDDKTAAYFLYITDPDDKTTVKNSYGVVGAQFSSTDTWLSSTTAFNTYKINGANAVQVGVTGGGTANAAATYSNWDINNDGAPGAKWRIYEGRTLPLLTAFMNGRVDSVGSVGVEYKYRKFNKDGTLVTDFAKASNNHADVPTGTLTYDSKIIKIVDGSDGIVDGSTLNNNVTYDKTLMDDQKNRVTTYTDTNTSALDRDNNVRNAGTKAMLWSDQDGPNLRGVNITIDKRKIDVKDSNLLAKRMYDGTRDVKDAFEKALKNGGLTASGFTDEDLNDTDPTRKITITPSSDFTATLDNKNVGKNKRVTFTGKIEFGGTNKGNYELGDFDFSTHPNIKGWAEITKAPLILKVLKDSANKVYDGTNTVTDVTMKANPNVQIDQTLTRVINGNTVVANIKNGGAGGTPDDVSMDTIPDPTYVKPDGTPEIHAGTHTIRYTNVKLKGTDAGNYELYYQMPDNTQTEVKNDRLDLTGTIERRRVKVDDFNVYDKTNHAKVDAKKVYDGNDEYTPTSNVYLSSNAVTGGTTGIVDRDRDHITFALEGGKGHFLKDTNKNNRTKNVKEATHVSYTVKGEADNDTDAYGRHLLSDYYVLDADGVTKNSLENPFDATGAGKITPRVLTTQVVNNHIEKTYDAMQEQTDGNRTVIKGNSLVELTGFVGGESRTNTSTANYASKNVDWDTAARTEKSQTVTYTASFTRGTGEDSDNYTLDPSGTTVTNSQTLAGNYTGTIKQRPLGLTFGNVTKIYDGTTTNDTKTVTGLDDSISGGTKGAVIGADGTTPANLSGLGSVTSQYADRHAGTNKSVEYNGLSDLLGSNHNYKIADKQYGTGTITRRLIENSGFQVRKKDGTIANASKVYDGTDKFRLADGSYLVAKTAGGSPNTGVVDRDKDNIYFTMTGNEGHFLKGTTGTDRTSHVSEARRVAYSVVANTKDGDVSPLSNYYFGDSYAAADRRDLESVNGSDPRDAVTAVGSITPASIQATTKEITKVYDGMAEHTDGKRNIRSGDTIVGLDLIADATGQPTNTSTAAYADKNVARDALGNVIKKNVTYKAQLTGTYADDYQIVDTNNHVISTRTGSGATQTVSATIMPTTATGTITPRKLKVTMGDVSKTYDGNAQNTSANITQLTDDPTSSVIGTIFSGDGVSAGALQTTYRGMLTANTASSNYGRLSGTNFTTNANASNGTQHDVQYANMDAAFRAAFSAVKDNYEIDSSAYGKGTINRKAIAPGTFNVGGAAATKVYDGTSAYKVPSGQTLTANTGELVGTDANRIHFAIDTRPGKGARFTKSDGVTETANVADAARVAYDVMATADAGYEHLLRNYTLNGANLEDGGSATGVGTITRRELELDLVQKTGIDKEYDRQTTLKDGAKHWNALTKTDSEGNVQYATGSNELVNDGTSLNITSNYMNDAGTAPDKNVKRSGGAVVDKNIQYNISIVGGDARNYAFKKGGAVTNAEDGLKLSATGKITPKDLSGAFKKVTKTYDGTKNVPTGQIGFTTGAVIAGDTVTPTVGSAQYQSENVNGDGSNWTPTGGTPQKNWVNYSGLTLTGADAGNYNLPTSARGLGEITPYELNDSSITFTKTRATKVYDGTQDVKWTNGSTAFGDVKNYITGATVTITPTGGGPAQTKNILNYLELKSAQYDKKDVDGGNATDRVTYKLRYTGTDGNFSLGTGVTSFETKGDGVITKKDVNVTVKSPLSKTYDATTAVKDAGGNPIMGSALNNLLTLTGLTGNDGATYTTTAQYADKNAGTGNKTVNYTLNIDAANAGNYNLKYKTGSGNAFSTNDNTITKRNVDVNFDHVSKDYDSKATNTTIAPKVSAADAAVLGQDSAGNVSGTNITNLTGVTSAYGTLSGGTFTPDANAGDKTVRYQGVGTAMGTVFGTNNYDFNVKDGTGRINRAKINAGNVVFDADDARKTYDGTTTVKYGGSSANSEVRKYINRIGVTLNGNWINLQNDVTMDSAEYSDANATNGTKHRVTYKFHLNNSNIDISGDNTFSKDKEGIIDRRVLNLDLTQKTGIDKIYDATPDVHNTDTRHYNAFVDHDEKGNVIYAAGTSGEHKLVRKDGNPEATVKVTTVYADENAGAKNVNYTARIEGDAGKNYTLKYGNTIEGNAETGINFAATGTIAKRKLTLGFDKASKQYDTLADNPDQKKLMSAIADNSDARGVDTLKRDGILAADGTVNTGAFDTTNVASEYGTRSNDPANPFTPDPNVGRKDVRYTNVKSALSGTKAGNYEIVDTVYGTGEITRAKIKAADFDFQIDPSKKTYDGTTTVYWKDKEGRWQEAKGKDGLDGAKKYYFGDRSTVKLANGRRVKVNPADFSLTEAAYQNKNVAGGTETWTDADGNTHHNWVNYKLHINTTNFDVEGERDTTRKGVGTITKRDLATMLPKHLIKEYDGQQTFDETNRDYVNALANQNITHIVEGDRDKVQLKVKGTYSDKNASAETKAEAEARTPAQAQRTVDYTLTLSGDAATLDNYTIGGQPTTNTVTGKADIYKKTLTVEVGNIDKFYDGTRTVVRDAGGGVFAPHPEAGKFRLSGFVGSESFGFDQTAADKIDGLYSDANVSRRNGAVVDKDIAYSGVKAAFKNYADNHAGGAAKNYRIDSDTAAGKGKILPRPITADEITRGLEFADATKVYDGTRAVKYNGHSTPDALKNYLTSAKVNINGTEIDIKEDISIKEGADYTHYDTPNVDGGRKTNRVTYGLTYTGSNFDISGDLTKTADGVITKRRVTAYAPGQLVKWYDGTDKVYDPLDNSIKTYRRNDMTTPVTVGEKIVRLSTQRGDTGLLNEHKDKNLSYAVYKGKDAGTGKEVTHYVKLADDVAGNYEVVNTRGEAIAQLKTKNNEIRKRRLDITFDHVRKPYDASPENRDVTAFVKNTDAQAALQRDRIGIFEDELNLQDADGNALVSSQYGYGSTDDSFTADANAGEKSVQYSGLGDALRNSVLGENAKNYDFDETGYGTGTIDKAKVRARDFDLRFDPANKEYDGTANVLDPLKQLNKGRSHIEWERHGRSKYNMPDTDIASITGTYVGTDGREDKNAGERKQVNYRVKLNDRNFDFVGGWDGVIKGEGGGTISKRKIIAVAPRYLTKEYDGTTDVVNRARDAEGNLIKGNGDALIGFRHADDTTKSALIAGDDVRNESTASYSDSNVAWKDRAWKNGHGTVDDMDVNYTLGLSGADSSNYEIVNPDGKTVGKGKITPKEIHLKSDPQTRWINEGLPDSYTGTPMGKNYETGVNGEVLPGEIYYASPDGRLRWGDYHINGYYRASEDPKYQRPDGSRYQLADKDKTPDGDSVARNYRFVQDPANATALHIGPYVPNTDYYQALTQTSKMLPDEYAYENASLDRRSHFGRDPEAEIAYMPPSLNMVKDGVDISKNGIEITDETVFRLVNEVFG